ncbi:MAG: hypothetical protein RL199_2332, partial [Pseudomonadota bacterium]
MKRVLVAVALSTAAAVAEAVEVVDFSAPILPKTAVLYAGEGANYPTTPASRLDLALDASLTFENLLLECAPLYPGITLQTAGGAPLTRAQLDDNYELVAQCSYERYTAKPYWIPQLLADVDVCGAVLGSDWTLPTEADLASLSVADYQFLEETLAAASGQSGWGNFYFSIKVFVRAADGSVQQGDLSPAAATRVMPLSFPSGSGPTAHYEAGLALRCL